jgi:hypothetical protein
MDRLTASTKNAVTAVTDFLRYHAKSVPILIGAINQKKPLAISMG